MAGTNTDPVYHHLLDGLARFGSSAEDACLNTIGVPIKAIRRRVVLAPWWEPEIFDALGAEATYLSPSPAAPTKVWDIKNGGFELTYIKTGIGAPQMTDVVLALGLTRCRNAVFIGSVGALDEGMSIGDVVIPECSVCGDGVSRYLTAGPLGESNPFGETSQPDARLNTRLLTCAKEICEKEDVSLHIGKTFSTDTVFAQFAHLDEILELGCDSIEMETAAAFRAARLAGIALAALFSVSDNTLRKKSLLSGRTPEELAYRSRVRRTVFPQILLKTLA